MAVRVLIAGNDSELRNELKGIVTDSGYEVAGMARDSQEAIQLVLQFAPHVALVSQDLAGASGLVTCEMLSALAPDVMPILIADSKTTDLADAALRSGARAIVHKPLNPVQLAQRIEELAEVQSRRTSEEFLQWKDITRFPEIVSVTGARGGVGKSTIASNLAIVLARAQKEKVLLFDLYTQFGDIPTMFNVTPKSTLVDVIPASDDLDVDMIDNSITRHPSGLDILVTTVDPLPINAISDEYMDNLLYVLKRRYRYVVIDVPPLLHRTTINVAAHSNLVLLVASLYDLTTVADTRKFFDALRQEQIPVEKLGIVLNRVSRENRLQAAEVEQLFECCVLAHFPNEPRLGEAVDHGVPLALQDGDSPFVRSMVTLAERVMGVPASAPEPTQTPLKRRLFSLRKFAT